MKTQENKEMLLRQGKRGLARIIFDRTMLILLLLVIQILILFSGMISWARDFVPVIFGSVLAMTCVTLVVVLNSKGDPTVRLSWAALIAVVPLVGCVLYYFVRFELGHRLQHSLYNATVADSASYIHQNRRLLERIEGEDRQFYNLCRYLRNHGNHPVYENTEVTYFPLGEDMFREMLQQLEKAEKFIFMEYFILAPGYMWDTLLEVLVRKARQGVEVRVLYDGTCAVALLPYGYPRQLRAMGIRCKMFAPIRPFVSTHHNNRDHRKIMVIDGHTAFTGGINIDDSYINHVTLHGHWKDTAVMVRGDAAQSFTMLFLQMWNTGEKTRAYEPYLRLSGERFGAGGCVIPFGDSPTDGENVGEMVYLSLLNQAKDYVWIMTPYLILDGQMLTALRFAAGRGVDVRLVLPHIPDKKSVFALAKTHYRTLLDAGVKIYEYTPGFVHAKVWLSDDAQGVVGTINLDYRSLYLHYECAAYLYRVPALRDIREDFVATMEKSQRITREDVDRRNPLSRLVGAVLKVFAPLM